MNLIIQIAQTIVMLCQVGNSSSSAEAVDRVQKSCHSYYAECLEDKLNKMPKCIVERHKKK